MNPLEVGVTFADPLDEKLAACDINGQNFNLWACLNSYYTIKFVPEDKPFVAFMKIA